MRFDWPSVAADVAQSDLVPLEPLKNRDEAEAAVALVTITTMQLTEEVNRQNAKIAEARKHDEEIKKLRARLTRYEVALKEWAVRNREKEFPADSKTLDMRQGRLIFKLAGRAVRLLDGWTEKMALGKLLLRPKWKKRYVRVEYSINRQQILGDTRLESEHKLDDRDLKRFGLAIRQEESFYVEPKLEPLRNPE